MQTTPLYEVFSVQEKWTRYKISYVESHKVCLTFISKKAVNLAIEKLANFQPNIHYRYTHALIEYAKEIKEKNKKDLKQVFVKNLIEDMLIMNWDGADLKFDQNINEESINIFMSCIDTSRYKISE